MSDCVAAAQEYDRRGWRPVPALGKRPLGERWADRSHDWAEFEGRNVGVVLGRRSGGLVDVDLDAPEALELADLYLPNTCAVFGRASKPAAHRLFVAEGLCYQKFYDPFCDPSTTKATLLELRSDTESGGVTQTIFPPSAHPEGELTRWLLDTDVRVVDAINLQWRCGVLASACMLRRYVDPALGFDWATNWRSEIPRWILGGFPSIGRLIACWLGRPDPIGVASSAFGESTNAEEVVEATENDLDWDTWVVEGLAIYRVMGEDSYRVFEKFSQRYHGSWSPKLTRQRWRSFKRWPPNRVGMGTLLHNQREHPRVT